MQAKGIWIFGGEPGLASPLTPDSLPRVHSQWQAVCDSAGPFAGPFAEPFAAGETCQQKVLPAQQETATGWWHAMPAQHALPGPLIVCGTCSSAFDVAHFFAGRALLPVWSGVLAVAQERGRGQLRRYWHSPVGNLHAVFRWPRPAKAWETLLPLVVAHWVIRVLGSFGLQARIKWPNDIFLQDRKVGGILVEERTEQGEGRILVGVGMNCASAAPRELLRRDGAHPATCLMDHAVSGRPVPTLLDIWHGLASLAKNEYSLLGSSVVPQSFLRSVEQSLLWLGQRVCVDRQDSALTQHFFSGVFSGLSQKGEAILVHKGESLTVRSGSLQQEVSQ